MALFGRRVARSAALAALLLLSAACGGSPPGAVGEASPTASPVATPTATATLESATAAATTPTPPPLTPSPAPSPTPTASPTAPATAVAPTATPEPITLTVAAVGDLMFARDIVTLMQQHGPAYPFERVVPLLSGNDLLIGNLEGTFTDRGEPLDKFYTFRAPPTLAETLRSAGFDAVTLANNHALDFGPVGLRDTLDALDALGVAYFGAGLDRREAEAPLILQAGGAFVALLGFSAVGSSVFAEGEEPGVARAEAEAVAASVAAIHSAVDFVIVVFHFGTEYDATPTGQQRELAAAAADAGAALVIGHHAHTLQPWERRGDALILYGLGNFVFDLDPDDLATLGEGPFATAVAVVELSNVAPPTLRFRPAYIDPDENRPRPATADERERILAALSELGED